jgi:ferritin-like metal-binding protein YciE
LQDTHHAETALTKALPNLAKAAGNADFKALVLTHLAETKQKIVILDKVFASIGKKDAGVKCNAIDGVIKETEGIIKDATCVALDACLIAAEPAVEHYEIARYGALGASATVLGDPEAHDLLCQVGDLEKAANSKLTGDAVSAVNFAKRAVSYGTVKCSGCGSTEILKYACRFEEGGKVHLLQRHRGFGRAELRLWLSIKPNGTRDDRHQDPHHPRRHDPAAQSA